MNVLVKSMAILFATVLFLGSPGVASAQDSGRTTLETKLDQLASLIEALLKEQKTLKFEKVECADPKNDPHGAWLQREMTVNLKKRKLFVNEKKNETVELQMEYGFTKTTDGVEEIYIQAKLIKKGDVNALPKLDRISSDDLRDKLRVSSYSISVPLDKGKQQRDAKYQADKANPQTHVSGAKKTLISATRDSKYFIELLVGPKGGKDEQFRPRRATIEGGVAFAKIDTDEEYRLRIVNNSSSEVACRVYIDGLCMFDLSDDRLPSGDPKYRYIIVAPGQSSIIPGWHRTAKGEGLWNAFLVTKFGQGVASGTNPKGPIGTIKVVFAQSYEPGSQQAKARSANETAQGRPLPGKQEPVIRQIENPHECVVVRYSRGISKE